MAETFTVFVDPRLNPSERRALGNSIVEYIFTRTKRGLGIGREPFTRTDGAREYSEAYQEHRDFDIANKNRKPINLTLTGDMLNSVQVLDISLAGQIVIGIQDGPNADKARFMREKGYIFLGLSEAEQKNIEATFAKVTPEEVRRSQISEQVAQTLLRNLFGG